MNLIGLAGAASLFIGIWLGHVAIRYIEARSTKLWMPIILCIALGAFLEILALRAESNLISAVIGILATTILWDALEFIRQDKRVQKGHAPANPANPRHVHYLTQHNTQATTLDPLKHSPTSRPSPGTKVDLVR